MISLCPVAKGCGVFSNRVLLSSSGGQRRATGIACIVLEISRTPLANNMRRGIPRLTLGFLFENLDYRFFFFFNYQSYTGYLLGKYLKLEKRIEEEN